MSPELYIQATFMLYVVGWVYSMYHKEWYEALFGFTMIVWGLMVLYDL